MMPDGRIVYTVTGAGSSDLFMVNADGANPRQLTSNTGLNGLPVVTPDGRFIVFVSTRSGAPHIWRMDNDGTNLKQLSNGIAELFPVLSPDGQWIVFQNITGEPGLWKVSIDGGNVERVTDKLATQAAISPDGKLLACRYRETALSPFRLALIDFATGKTVKTIDIPPTNANFDWSADGRSVLYIDTHSGVSNLWSQPIEGGAPQRLTNFKSDLIFNFDMSRDGKQIAFSRGTTSNDVVLIADVPE